MTSDYASFVMARIIETEVGKNSIQKKSVKRQNLLSEWLTDVKGKRRRTDEEVEGKVEDIEHVEDPCWTKVSKADLSVTYSVIFDRNSANKIFASLESEIEYFTGDLAQIKVFGKLHPIPRQQSAYGDPGVKYVVVLRMLANDLLTRWSQVPIQWPDSPGLGLDPVSAAAAGGGEPGGGGEVQLRAGQQVQGRRRQDGRSQG